MYVREELKPKFRTNGNGGHRFLVKRLPGNCYFINYMNPNDSLDNIPRGGGFSGVLYGGLSSDGIKLAKETVAKSRRTTYRGIVELLNNTLLRN
jgi:hypothetical protein